MIDKATASILSAQGRQALADIGTAYDAGGQGQALRNYNPGMQSADGALAGAQSALWARSADMMRNSAIAHGALTTARTNAIGAGLRPESRIDPQRLGLSEDAAQEIGDAMEAAFRRWADSPDADIRRERTFWELQDQAFASALTFGDVGVLRRLPKRRGARRGVAVQLVEGPRIVSPYREGTVDRAIRLGVESDSNGAAVAYHVTDQQPDVWGYSGGVEQVRRVPAFDRSGVRQFLLLKPVGRVDQTRGVPWLTPVIVALKQLTRYSEAELTAAVLAAYFTVFVKRDAAASPGQIDPLMHDLVGDVGAAPGGDESPLGEGSIVDLAPGEDITIASPNRPNDAFQEFFRAITSEIAVGLGLAPEMLLKHFTASYSASRAAIEVSWQTFMCWRHWMAAGFCQPVWEWVISREVAEGRIAAPGFFADPDVRAAWLAADWIGASKMTLDPVKDAKAAEIEAARRFASLDEISRRLTGRDWMRKVPQLRRERAVIQELGGDDAPLARDEDEEETDDGE